MVLNTVYWYVPALLAPTIVAITRRYRLGHTPWTTTLGVHLASAFAFSVIHTSVMLMTRAVLFANYGRGMAPCGLVELPAAAISHATRLDAGDVLLPRRPRTRDRVLARGGRAGAQRRTAADAPGRSAAAGAAASAPAAFSLQHAAHDLQPDAERCRSGGPHDRSAERPAPNEPAIERPGSERQAGDRDPAVVSGDRADAVPRSPERRDRRGSRRAGRARSASAPAAARRERRPPRDRAAGAAGTHRHPRLPKRRTAASSRCGTAGMACRRIGSSP